MATITTLRISQLNHRSSNLACNMHRLILLIVVGLQIIFSEINLVNSSQPYGFTALGPVVWRTTQPTHIPTFTLPLGFLLPKFDDDAPRVLPINHESGRGRGSAGRGRDQGGPPNNQELPKTVDPFVPPGLLDNPQTTTDNPQTTTDNPQTTTDNPLGVINPGRGAGSDVEDNPGRGRDNPGRGRDNPGRGRDNPGRGRAGLSGESRNGISDNIVLPGNKRRKILMNISEPADDAESPNAIVMPMDSVSVGPSDESTLPSTDSVTAAMQDFTANVDSLTTLGDELSNRQETTTASISSIVNHTSGSNVLLTESETARTSEEDTLPPSEEDALPPSEENTLPLSEEDTLPPSEEDALPPSEEDALPPSAEKTLPPSDEDALPPSEEDALSPLEEDALRPSEEHTLTPGADYAYDNSNNVIAVEQDRVTLTRRNLAELPEKLQNFLQTLEETIIKSSSTNLRNSSDERDNSKHSIEINIWDVHIPDGIAQKLRNSDDEAIDEPAIRSSIERLVDSGFNTRRNDANSTREWMCASMREARTQIDDLIRRTCHKLGNQPVVFRVLILLFMGAASLGIGLIGRWLYYHRSMDVKPLSKNSEHVLHV